MNQLPECWKAAPLGEITDYGAAKQVRPDEIGLESWVLELEDVEKDTSKLLQRVKLKERKSKSNKSRFGPGDVLYGKLRPYLNKVILADDSGYCTTEIIPITPASGIESRWIFYALKHPAFIQHVAALCRGINMPRLTTEDARSVEIAVPPTNEQRRIVAKLDALFEKSRSIREKVDRLPELLDSVRKSILASAFNGDWWEKSVTPNWHPIGLLGKVTGGLTKNSKRTSFPLQLPYLRVANVYANKLLLDDVTLIGATPQEAEKTRLEKGDLLVVEGNGSLDQIGRVAIFDGSIDGCLHQNHLIRVRFPSEILSRWVLFWLLSPAGRGQIVDVASSTTGLHTLSISKVSALRVPVVDEATMQQTLNRLEVALHGVALLEAKCSALKTAVAMTEQATLAKAFRGELVPQNPNDEPASVLLERIRAQKPAVGTKRGRGRKTAGQAEEPVPG